MCKLKLLFCLAGALTLLGDWPASAADLAVKAGQPRPRVLATYSGCGSYYGIHTVAAAARTDVQGTPGSIGTPYAVGAAVGGTLGYLCGDGVGWKAIEGMISYQNLGATSPATDTAVEGMIESRWGATVRGKLGGPIANMLNLLPNLSTILPVFPEPAPGTLPTTNHPYLFGAVHVDRIKGSVGMAEGDGTRVRGGFGVGVMSELGRAQNNPQGSRVVMDTWVEYIAAGSGVTLGGIDGSTGAANQGREIRVGMAILY
jgi:hypothetical protein